MPSSREPLITDLIFIVVGLGGIAGAVLRLGNNIVYPPGDPRSQPWFDPLVSAILGLASLFFLVVGSIRIIQGLRDRRK
jgi:dipeptide/tripeptide permease